MIFLGEGGRVVAELVDTSVHRDAGGGYANGVRRALVLSEKLEIERGRGENRATREGKGPRGHPHLLGEEVDLVEASPTRSRRTHSQVVRPPSPIVSHLGSPPSSDASAVNNKRLHALLEVVLRLNLNFPSDFQKNPNPIALKVVEGFRHKGGL
ncbi:uncharacterized protein LOC119281251 isoform X1 [Triticum dicoccoides]|uniref:uncharacterized protein n=1 Tax=Triticum aestivum TaxID=4565 RepID=UPI00188E9AFD|nr:uncharacterized protein LOC119281251 isoform X1 [Triticum dicoccoides]XP_044447106.1 uncharacterized protein LOC123177404 [Triticum aestivum]